MTTKLYLVYVAEVVIMFSLCCTSVIGTRLYPVCFRGRSGNVKSMLSHDIWDQIVSSLFLKLDRCRSGVDHRDSKVTQYFIAWLFGHSYALETFLNVTPNMRQIFSSNCLWNFIIFAYYKDKHKMNINTQTWQGLSSTTPFGGDEKVYQVKVRLSRLDLECHLWFKLIQI